MFLNVIEILGYSGHLCEYLSEGNALDLLIAIGWFQPSSYIDISFMQWFTFLYNE